MPSTYCRLFRRGRKVPPGRRPHLAPAAGDRHRQPADHPRDLVPPAGGDHHQRAAAANLPGVQAPVAEGVGRAGQAVEAAADLRAALVHLRGGDLRGDQHGDRQAEHLLDRRVEHNTQREEA